MPRLEDALKINIVEDVVEPTQPINDDIPINKSNPESPLPMEGDDDELGTTEPELPQFVSKPAPSSDDIFDEDEEEPSPLPVKPAPLVKKVIDDDIIIKQEFIGHKNSKGKVTINKNGRPRKPMSEEHKAKLKLAREKAAAKKSFLAAERKKVKDEAKAEREKKKLLKQEENDRFMASQQPEPAPAPEPVEQKTSFNGITMKDIEEMQLRTMMTMEKMRQQRKQEKKQKALEEQYKTDMLDTMKKIVPPSNTWKDTAGLYSNCF